MTVLRDRNCHLVHTACVLALLTVSGLVSCRAAPREFIVSRKEPGWPDNPKWHSISGCFCEETKVADAVPFNLDASDVLVKCYIASGEGFPHKDAFMKSVYYLRDLNVFYVQCACQGDHYDGFCGPFNGDPRRRLRP